LIIDDKNNDLKEKKQWETPEITVISGLDSCVEFLYTTGGTLKPWPPKQQQP
jgi:hypothetical protein